jgi:inosine/xanthosine triphosphatase
MKLVVGSSNPVKLAAARDGFAQVFGEAGLAVHGCDVPSGVPAQPFGDIETRQGAYNRAAAARAATPQADYWFGIEGGIAAEVVFDTPVLHAFAWVVVLNAHERLGMARTGTFVLPEAVAELVRAGVELGEADDRVFGRHNSKHSDGAVGLLTGGVIDRRAYYAHAVVLALVPFCNPTLAFPLALNGDAAAREGLD